MSRRRYRKWLSACLQSVLLIYDVVQLISFYDAFFVYSDTIFAIVVAVLAAFAGLCCRGEWYQFIIIIMHRSSLWITDIVTHNNKNGYFHIEYGCCVSAVHSVVLRILHVSPHRFVIMTIYWMFHEICAIKLDEIDLMMGIWHIVCCVWRCHRPPKNSCSVGNSLLVSGSVVDARW